MVLTGHPKGRFSRVRNLPPFVWMFLFCALMFIVTVPNFRPNIDDMVPITQEFKLNVSQKGYVIRTDGCKIPDLQITTKTLEKEYFEYEYSGAHCNNDLPPLIESNLTSIFIEESSLKSYNISSLDSLSCCYVELKRNIPHGNSDDQYEFSKECVYFVNETRIDLEFIRVNCYYDENLIYQDFFSFIPKKQTKNATKEEKMNVLIIGIDGVSRLNFHRQMPKTVNFLKQLEFQEFFGYNKVADNTYPNLITVLTGDDEKTIDETCRKHGKYYDNCSFIWDNFKDGGYTTSFAEDSAWMGLFNYQRYGFQKQPTDYMWGFFDRIAERLAGNSKSMNVIQCIGPREGFKMIVQYIYDFVYSMQSWNLPYFAFFWSSSLSHGFLNKPRIGDEVYMNLLEKLHNEKFFENTIVIVMSDHGIRFGDFRQTYQGRIEERLPLFFIRLPENFKSKYSLATTNLKINSRRLTTPFDLHETLYDLATPENLKNEFIERGYRKPTTKHGISLFHKVNQSRTCKAAGIDDHWCTCLESNPVNITSEIIKVGTFAVNHLNKLLEGYAQCATLRLSKVLNAQIMTHPEETFGSEGGEDILISFETEPGKGSFEATVRKDKGKMEILGTVSRLNLYGKQSMCITDFHLKLYCYCKKNVWD